MLSGCFLFKKCHLNDFEHSMVVGARQPGHSISETMALLGFTHTEFTEFTEFTENSLEKKKKIFSENQFSG